MNIDSCRECSHSTRNNPPLCGCKEGFYDDEQGNTECIKCPNECKNCNKNQECKTCKPGLNRNNYPPCNCLSGFYDNRD